MKSRSARRSRRRRPLSPATIDPHRAASRALSPFQFQEWRVEHALLSGESPADLDRLFGEGSHAELRELARQAASRSVRGGPRVLILPGIMGSTLGIPRKLINDVVWIDPKEVISGNLPALSLDHGDARIEALGAILLAYLKLKLRLRIAGFDADFFAYDWRQDLESLGRRLALHLRDKEHADQVDLVCHSMGGLVARAALRQGAPRLAKLVMLGTPNLGSFVPMQALKGAYPVIRKIAFLDPFHSVEELCIEVFSTFPGLYGLMVAPEKFQKFDLYDPAAWPKTGPMPRPQLLRSARDTQKLLAPPRDNFYLIAGINEDTITDLDVSKDEFIYTTTSDGDGTVPLALAELPGVKTYYVEESHGSLANNRSVARAVADLLESGQTEALPDERPARRAMAPRMVRHSELLREPPLKIRRGAELPPSDARELLEGLASPTARDSNAVLVPKFPPKLHRVSVARHRQQRIDLVLARGSITEVSARAVVLGVFRNVAPTGAARAMDDRLDGAVAEATARRMFSGGVGEIFILPTGRHPVHSEVVLFAGLGGYEHFKVEVLEIVAENVVRTLVRTNIEELATVLMSGASGRNTVEGICTALQHLVRGFFRGLLDADSRRDFRRITICETDPARYEAIRDELFRLTSTPLFEEIEVTFDEIELPTPLVTVPAARGVVRGPDPAYLTVRQEAPSGGAYYFHSVLLTAGGKATVVESKVEVPSARLDQTLKRLDGVTKGREPVDRLGADLAQLIFSDTVRSALPSMRDRHLIVVHDEFASRIPWETLKIGDYFPAIEGGLSRKYMSRDISVAKWLEERREDEELNVLLVVNPTGDLGGAEDEGDRIQSLLTGTPRLKLEVRFREEARKDRLKADFCSGRFDIIHYAGHAFFDAAHPAKSGILCAGEQVLSGAELASLGNLPSLVFFNACEAGRIRKPRRPVPPLSKAVKRPSSIRERIDDNVSLAEAFLRGGVANYVGTYWPVGDASASTFAVAFYKAILERSPLGPALLAARNEVRKQHKNSVDWADYILYGSHEFVLKMPSA
ncbi:MAG: CHAT domain-containing protein [Verrucomicrobia bacterium]|nr:CHAT domain-containing protein [Verrucomicrobiota bacterium]